MSKINVSTDFTQLKDLDSLKTWVTKSLSELLRACNGLLTPVENVAINVITVKFTSANVQQSTRHGLGRAPTGYIPLSKSAAMDVYDGGTTNTTEILYLKASAAGTVRLWVF